MNLCKLSVFEFELELDLDLYLEFELIESSRNVLCFGTVRLYTRLYASHCAKCLSVLSLCHNKQQPSMDLCSACFSTLVLTLLLHTRDSRVHGGRFYWQDKTQPDRYYLMYDVQRSWTDASAHCRSQSAGDGVLMNVSESRRTGEFFRHR